MAPVLIVHQDNIWGELDLKIENGNIVGTLDNFLGVALIFKLLPFLQEYNIPVIFTSGEEINLSDSKKLASDWPKDKFPIVIDVTPTSDCDCAIENIYKLSNKEISGLKHIIEWHEDFKVKIRKYDATPGDEDDSWSFIRKDIPTFCFGIPVIGNFHTKNCKISVEKFERVAKCLKWLLSYYL